MNRGIAAVALWVTFVSAGSGCATGGTSYAYEFDSGADSRESLDGTTGDAVDGATDGTGTSLDTGDTGGPGDSAGDGVGDALGDGGDGGDATIGDAAFDGDGGGSDGAVDSVGDGASDSGAPDTAPPDSGPPDTGVPDTATVDTGTDTGADTGSGGCSRPTDCTGGLECGGPTLCGTSVCFKCSSSSGTTTGYGACSTTSACASGVCDTLRGHCSAACASGTTGDSDCTTAMGSGFACTEISYSVGSSTATLGFCAKKCARNADCSGTDVCQAATNDGYNRVDLTCGAPAPGSSGMGASCTSGAACGTELCVSSKCTAPCVTAADCSGGLTKCSAVLFSLPKGGTQLVNVCTP